MQLSLRHLLLLILLAALQRSLAGVLIGAACCFHFQVWATANPDDLLWIHNLGRLDVKIGLRALLLLVLPAGECALHAKAIFESVSVLAALIRLLWVAAATLGLDLLAAS